MQTYAIPLNSQVLIDVLIYHALYHIGYMNNFKNRLMIWDDN